MQVTNSSNLAVALHSYCNQEILDGESAYQCDTCQTKQKAYRCTKLQSLPRILTFTCNRFKIDRTTNWQRVKVTAKSEYPLFLNMHHFHHNYDLAQYYSRVHQTNTNLNKGIEPFENQETLQMKANESMLFYKEIYAIASSFINSKINDSPLINSTNVQSIMKQFQLNNQDFEGFKSQLIHSPAFEAFRQCPEDNYLLHAIIIHRGSAYSGHYFAFIRDNMQEGKSSKNSTGVNPLDKIYDAFFEEIMAMNPNTDISEVNPAAVHSVIPSEKNHSKPILSLDYIFLPDENTYYISSQHLIGKIINIFRTQESQFKSKNNRKHKFSNDKPFFLSSNAIQRELALLGTNSQQVGGTSNNASYAKAYKPIYGNLEDFMKKFQLFFQDVTNTCGVAPTSSNNQPNYQYSLKPTLNIYLMPETDFATKLSHLKQEEKEKLTSMKSSAGSMASSGASLKPIMNFKDSLAASNPVNDEWQMANKKAKGKKATPASTSSSVASHEDDDNNSVISTASNKANVSESSSQKTPFYLNSEENIKLLKSKLTEYLLNKTVGNFYEFNDSQVNLIEYSKLDKSFEGVNSAYLLVYRKIDTLADFFVRPNEASLLPSPPREWIEKVQEKNLQLAQEREQYDNSMKQISVFVYFQSDVEYQSPFFRIKHPSTSSKVKAEGEKEEPHYQTNVITVDSTTSIQELIERSFHQHLGIGVNRPVVSSDSSAPSPPHLLPPKINFPPNSSSYNSSFEVNGKTYIISKLDKYQPNQYYASDGLIPHVSTEQYKLKTNDLLLIFSPPSSTSPASSAVNLVKPPSVADGEMYYGLKYKPVEVKLSFVERRSKHVYSSSSGSTTTAHATSSTNPAPGGVSSLSATAAATKKTTGTHATNHNINHNINLKNRYDLTFYLPNTFTLNDVLKYFSAKYQVSPELCVLSALIPNFQNLTAIATASSMSNNNNCTTAASATFSNNSSVLPSSGGTGTTGVWNTNTHYFYVLYKDKEFFLNNAKINHQQHNLSYAPIAITEKTTLHDLWFLRELHFEANLHHVFESKTVAEEYLQSKSQLVTYTVELDDSLFGLLPTKCKEALNALDLHHSIQVRDCFDCSFDLTSNCLL